MTPTIDFEEQEDFLKAYFADAAPTTETGVHCFSVIAEECRKRDCRKAMVVEVLEPGQSAIEVFQTARKLPELLRGLALAFVYLDDEFSGDSKFAEDVAVNRGATLRVFRDECDAARWLASC